MPAAKEIDMSNETEQRKRVMAWAHEAQRIREQGDRHDAESYADNHLPDTMELIAVLLAQEEENAEQRTLLERWSEAWSSKDRRYPYPETRAHLRGTKAGWSEVLGILNDGSTPRETLEEVTQKFIDDETERRAEADEIEPLHPSLADSAAPSELYLPWRKIKDAAHCYIVDAVYEPVFAEADYDETVIDAIVEAVNAHWGSDDDEPLTREVRHRVALMRDNTRLRQRVAELEQAITKPVENWLDNRAEVTRLREGLETVRKWLTQKGLSPDEYDMVMDFISNALAGEKGAESEDNTATTTIGNSLVDTGGNSNRTDGNTEESGGSEVGKDADASIQQAQTPLSESLELGRRQCNASNSTVGGDPAGRLDLANAIFLNDMAHQIEQRDADVVAAIAALTAGQYRIEEEDRQQRDLWSKQQEKIDALTEAVLLLGTEVAIPKRKRETTIALGKLRKNGGE
jgi:hypothetical protein